MRAEEEKYKLHKLRPASKADHLFPWQCSFTSIKCIMYKFKIT